MSKEDQDAAAAKAAEEAKARGDEHVDDGNNDGDAAAAKLAAEEAAKKKTEEEEAARKAKADKGEEGEETDEEREERERQERNERIRIPKRRFDEAQQKARVREEALLREIEELKNAGNKDKHAADLRALNKEIEELEDKYEDELAGGKKDEARKIRKELNAKREHLSNLKSAAANDKFRRETVDEQNFLVTLTRFEQKYPELNPDDEENFDEELTNEVSQLVKELTPGTKSRAAALERAVAIVMKGRDKPAAKKGEKTDAELKAEREEAARKKAAEAAGKQPAKPGTTGKDSDKLGQGKDGKVDVMKLSRTAFDKLDDDAKAKLRGDDA